MVCVKEEPRCVWAKERTQQLQKGKAGGLDQIAWHGVVLSDIIQHSGEKGATSSVLVYSLQRQ